MIVSASHRMAAVIAAIALCAAAVQGCSRQKPEEEHPVVTVDVAPVLTSSIQQKVTSDALLFPKQQAAIVPKVTAPVKKFYVNRGDRVREGQLLAELENKDLQAAAAEAQAALTQAEAAYQTAVRATLPEEVQKAGLDVRAAKDALDAVQSVYDNRVKLFMEGAIARKDVNDAQVALVQARNQYEIAQKHLDNIRSVSNAEATKAAQAQRDAAKGRYDNAAAQLSFSRITSPIDGVVTDRPLYAGETPSGSAPLITVMQLSSVIARAHIPPADAQQLKAGDAANLVISEHAPISGKVILVSPSLDPNGTTIEIWVEAPNPDGALKPGTSVRAEVIAKTVSNALVIPQAAVLTSSSGSTSVIVVDPQNKPHKTSVTLGIRDTPNVQVTDGLQTGQRVATTGAYELGKLDADILEKTSVKIAPPKEEEDDDK
jgi:multidrug efflux pump subunit AcrA (membrane-fusion protein)